jgi:hypothetical protein
MASWTLSACATDPPRIITETERVIVTPPEEWIQETPIPQLEGDKNRHLLESWRARGESLERCNQDKHDLRQWRTRHQEDPEP